LVATQAHEIAARVAAVNGSWIGLNQESSFGISG
jgi:hypothetical protein